MSEGFVPDDIDWRRIVDEMNVSFGILRFEPAAGDKPSDIFLLYANDTYKRHLEGAGYDLEVLENEGYVGSGSKLDAQMAHNIREALERHVQVHDKLYVTSMKLWIDYYITPMDHPNWYYIVIINIDDEQRHLKKVERLGLVDALTEVENRNALQVALRELRGGDRALGAVAADLNGLKRINDEEGHAAGDAAIAGVARLLKESFPEWDIYRYGGDEFVVLAVGVERRAFEDVAGAFVARFGMGDSARLSAGCAWGPSSAEVDAIMRRADDAMYAAKRAYYTTHDRRH